jgi:hypothetical protein
LPFPGENFGNFLIAKNQIWGGQNVGINFKIFPRFPNTKAREKNQSLTKAFI